MTQGVGVDTTSEAAVDTTQSFLAKTGAGLSTSDLHTATSDVNKTPTASKPFVNRFEDPSETKFQSTNLTLTNQ